MAMHRGLVPDSQLKAAWMGKINGWMDEEMDSHMSFNVVFYYTNTENLTLLYH